MQILVVMLAMAAGVFVWFTGQAMPPIVASHFNAAGIANGFMPRAAYLGLMMVLVAAVPLVTMVMSGVALSKPGARINLPNRDYWLAPERRAGTIAFLQAHMAGFSALLVVFLAYGHWLVVRANLSGAQQLQAGWMQAGLCVFIGATILWIVLLIARFRRPAG